jgi:MYXO-CTERM domain-containing protein
MKRIRLVLGLAAVVVSASGCGNNVYVSDDEGATRPGSGLGAHPDELSLPYALGTAVALRVRNATATTAWTVVSDTPEVFNVDGLAIEDDGTLVGQGHALAEGEARVRVLDDGGCERRAVQVRVRAADRARFFAHGDLRVLGNDSSDNYASAEVTDARVLAGGKAVLAVAYYRGTERVYGRGIANIPPVAQLAIANEKTAGAPTNEWLFVTPAAPGSYALALTQGSTTLGTLPVTAVADSDLAGMSIAEEPTAHKGDKDKTWLLARARTSDGREVLGVYSDWTLDGVAQTGDGGDVMTARGDLYRYRRAANGATRTVTATHGTLTASATVQAYDGYVSNTTYLGCAAAPGSAPSSGRTLIVLVASLLGIALLARRRAAAATSSWA